MLPVSLLPCHPNERAASMLKYWVMLAGALRPDDEVKFTSPVGDPVLEFGPPSRLRRAFSRYITYPLMVRRDPARLHHLLDHSSAHLLKSSRAKAKIATVHDLIPLRFPGGLSNAQVRRFRSTVENLERADLVLSDSQATASEIVEFLGLPEERIRVMPIGCDNTPASEEAVARVSAQVAGIKDRVELLVLSIGSMNPRKNLALIPRALELNRAQGRKVGILRVGVPLTDDLRREFGDVVGSENLLELGFASEEDLAAAYAVADAMVFPSTYEGFGLPVLEAMAQGTVAVCANATSLPEVGGDVAMYFDPHSAEELADCMEQLCRQPAERMDRETRGIERAAEFTWRKHLEDLFPIYREFSG